MRFCKVCHLELRKHEAEVCDSHLGRLAATAFHGKTCGECAWIADPSERTGMGGCRRVAWGDTGTQYGFGYVSLGWPACPAFVPKEGSEG